jgi:nucleotide-binding universal stress UspA family protein
MRRWAMMWPHMYDNVIVAFDGGLEMRAALAPAADLAWRCDAKLVVVNTTAASDQASRLVLKTQAISMSGADIDFWVDVDHEIGPALALAASHRGRSVICVASRYRAVGVVRRRQVATPLPPEVFADAPAPVLTIGPEADISRGLQMTELVVALDGSPTAAAVLPLAAEWGARLRVGVRLVGLVREDGDADGLAAELEQVLADLSARVPEASLEVLRTDDAAGSLLGVLARRPDTVAMLATSGSGDRAEDVIGPLAVALVRRSARPVLLVRSS